MTISNAYTNDEINDIINSVAQDMAAAVNSDAAIDNMKGDSKERESRIAQRAFPFFESIGLDPSESATQFNKNPTYANFKNTVLTEVSRQIGDDVETSKRGEPVFSSRVKKRWSRIVTNYRKGDGDTSATTESDKEARKRYNEHKKYLAEMGEIMDVIVTEMAEGHSVLDDEIDVLLNRAIATRNQRKAEL